MYKRIIVGVDGSSQGELALRHAAGLAQALGASLRIAHVIDSGRLHGDSILESAVPRRISPAQRARGKALLDKALEVARAAGASVDAQLIEPESAGQAPVAALLDAARAFEAELIVLGARGRSAVERLLLGSMADGVAQHATGPVLLVH